ncbi:MAG TPA: reverse transcriptase domain-containing protein [Ilumatobacteraceae bacterium]|nr:reverse transcriptase domain-containing protein [Ilumatobacteraceae bacterium]
MLFVLKPDPRTQAGRRISSNPNRDLTDARHTASRHPPVSSRRHLGTLVRYADDLVVLCHTRQRAEQARERVAAILALLGLHLHPDKTRIVSLTQGREGFDFLGFHHRMVESWKRRDRYFLNKRPSARAMASIRAKVRQRTDRRYASADLGDIVGSLNPVLRG